MTQDNNEEIALTTDVGSDGDLLVEQFVSQKKILAMKNLKN